MDKSNPRHRLKFRNPGVYVEEVSLQPYSIAEAETAIPVFIGYTQLSGGKAGAELKGVPKFISSVQEYVDFFGTAGKEQGLSLKITQSPGGAESIQAQVSNPHACLLYYSIQAFFANGGSKCFVISVGNSGQKPQLRDYMAGLLESKKEARITILCFPDVVGLLEESDYYQLMGEAMLQCHKLRNRFLLVDLHSPEADNLQTLDRFRNLMTQTEGRQFSAAYYPYINSQLDYSFQPEDVLVHLLGNKGHNRPQTINLLALRRQNESKFNDCIAVIRKTLRPVLPPSPYVAGVYARVDRQRGVWKAPANVVLKAAQGLTANVNNQEQARFNVDSIGGKSVNVIREFPGRGILVWGARTLAGNDNEWRYVPVRRLFIMIESSVKAELKKMVLEPNDTNTWVKVRSMTESFLQELWRKGALFGMKSEEAFFVRIGLGQTMTTQDIIDGKMIMELGLSAIRPSEFLVLRITQNMKAT